MEALAVYAGILNLIIGLKMLYDTQTECRWNKILQTIFLLVTCVPLTASYFLFKGIVF